MADIAKFIEDIKALSVLEPVSYTHLSSILGQNTRKLVFYH